MGRLENKTGLCENSFMQTTQDDDDAMHKFTRFSSSGFTGCHNSTPLTMDLALEIRLMVPERRSVICVFSLHVDPRDTTNKDSFFILKTVTPPTKGSLFLIVERT